MTDEELAVIEARANAWDGSLIVAARTDALALVAALRESRAEVERLRAVVAEYGAAIDEHHADFVKIKAIVSAAIAHSRGDGYGPAWVAVHEIDRMVR